MNPSEIVEKIRKFADEEAKLADHSSHEWAKEFPGSEQAAYRSGVWFTYRQIQCLLPPAQ